MTDTIEVGKIGFQKREIYIFEDKVILKVFVKATKETKNKKKCQESLKEEN